MDRQIFGQPLKIFWQGPGIYHFLIQLQSKNVLLEMKSNPIGTVVSVPMDRQAFGDILAKPSILKYQKMSTYKQRATL
jgi:hypothetical protein